MNCENTITFGSFYATEKARGFARKEVLKYRCSKCGAEHRGRKNWHGPTPRGAFICGRELIH